EKMCLRIPEGIEALVMVDIVAGNSSNNIIKEIREIPGVMSVNEISGEFDVIAFVKARSIKELNESVDSIRETKGVASTETRIILSEMYTEHKEEKAENIKAMVMLTSSTKYQTPKVAQELLKNLAVKKTYEISGKHDLVAFVEAKDIPELNKRLEEVKKTKGVTKTITYVILK
ncbi:MAG: Lrp/AsnC ligand binding domain-containing protein, partial [Candidatus Jordarchaeaceae archaeon]